jgi:hypothetical protein
VFAAEPALVERAERAVDALKARGVLSPSLNRVRGEIGSGDVFVHDGEHHRAHPIAVSRPLRGGVEGAAVARPAPSSARPSW